MKFLALALFILAILIAIYAIGSQLQQQQFKKEIQLLFAQSSIFNDKKFSYDQLSELPEPVQKYFKNVLKEGQSFTSFVRLKHDGNFKTGIGKDWVPITGEQYFTVQKPGFIWKGKASIVTAYDMYLADKGRLRVMLLNLFKVVDAQGQSIDQGELLRWLGESFWFPTNLLPSERLKWSPIDSTSAKLSFSYNNFSLDYKVNFNENNEAESVETQRFMEKDRLETWVGEFFNYKEINGVIVPTNIKATWKLKEGDHTYVDFHLKEIEYDKPEQF